MRTASAADQQFTRGQAIRYYDRYDRCVKEEAIFGEKFLRWAYETRSGRLAVEALAKRALFSRAYGWWASAPSSKSQIARFVEQYGIDLAEARQALPDFDSFNAFFTRRLKPEARPITEEAGVVVFPADGRHLGYQDLSQVDFVYAKGQRFDLPELLGDSALAERYRNGAVVISRLCPVDYHRFHFSVAGLPGPGRLINGSLYSVSPVALRRNLGLLAENKRVLTEVDAGPRLGRVLVLEIGATNVGSIVQTHVPGVAVERGDEKGYFAFGGSMTMVFFEPGRVSLEADLLEQTAQGRELFARMGDRLGRQAH